MFAQLPIDNAIDSNTRRVKVQSHLRDITLTERNQRRFEHRPAVATHVIWHGRGGSWRSSVGGAVAIHALRLHLLLQWVPVATSARIRGLGVITSEIKMAATRTPATSPRARNHCRMAQPRAAFAKLVSIDYEYFVQKTLVIFGHRTRTNPTHVDIEFGADCALISKRHAALQYNARTRRFELEVSARSGVYVNGTLYGIGAPPVVLESNDRIEFPCQVRLKQYRCSQK